LFIRTSRPESRINVVNDIDWHETHVLLKAAFPLAASSNKATNEIPYGNIQRPTTRNNRWEQAQFEVTALRWADRGDGQHGFSLLNIRSMGTTTRTTSCAYRCYARPSGPIRIPIADTSTSLTLFTRMLAIGNRR
jgi:alpha-mannosidase